jgi:hypothetical protein
VRVSGKLNPIMQKVLNNKKIAKALDQPRERKEFFGMIKGVSEGGVYKSELRKLFGDLRSGKVRSRTINAKEVRIIAKELFPDSARRYEFAGSKPSENKSPDTLQNNSPKKASFRTMKPSSKEASYKTTRPNPESKVAVTPANNAPIAPIRIVTAKSHPARQYSPSDSLKYEFAKPGLRPIKEPEKKQDTVIKPVAPEVYAKVLNMPQKITKTAEKKETSPNKSTSLISDIAKKTSKPEEKKKEATKPFSLESKERLAFPKSTLPGNTASASEKKDLSIGIKTAALSLNDISPNKAIQTEALINSARKKMMAARGNEESEEPKRTFFSSMAATMRNKKN